MLSTEICYGTRAIILKFGYTTSQVNGKIKFRLKNFLKIGGRALHYVILIQSVCEHLSKLETVLKVLSFQSTETQKCIGRLSLIHI